MYVEEEMKQRIGEVMSVAPWTELDLTSDENIIMKNNDNNNNNTNN